MIRDHVPPAEPVLSRDDLDAWEVWRKTALVHASTRAFARRVQSAKDAVSRWVDQCERPCVSWSGGKDSVHETSRVWLRLGDQVHYVTAREAESLVGGVAYLDPDGRTILRPTQPWEILTASSEMQREAKPVFCRIEYLMAHDVDAPLYEFSLRGGRSLTTTGDHSVMIGRTTLRRGTKMVPMPASDVSVGDFMAVADDLGFDTPDLPDLPDWLLRLAGLWIADGCYVVGRKVIISAGGDPDVCDFLSRIPRTRSDHELASVAVNDAIRHGSKKKEAIKIAMERTSCSYWTAWNATYKGDKLKRKHEYIRAKVSKKGDVWLCDKGLVDRMMSMGLAGDSYTKKVPSWLFGASRRQIGIFLAGYLDGDGYFPQAGGVSCSTVSTELASGIVALMARLGIPCGLSSRSTVGGFRSTMGACYIVNANSHTAAVALAKWVPSFKKQHVPRGAPSNRRKFPFSTAKVTSVRRVPQGRVYDFEVADKHTFLANNVLVHNSTCMTHLVCVEMGLRERVTVLSEKDDLDYPGEEQYVLDTAAAWGLRLHLVRPPVSPWGWLIANRHALGAGSEMHARSSGLSKACFYGVMEAADRPFDGVALGLRSQESATRRRVRETRGRVFRLASGQVRCLPVADWSGLDVLAYAHSRGVELLHVYRCLAMMHRDEPWLIRKSWWIPGSHAGAGGVQWLRRYYPSLYEKLCSLFGDAWQYTA